MSPRPVFSVDVVGHFTPAQLHIVWHDEPWLLHPEIDAMVAEAWDRSCAGARRERRRLFNGRLVKLLRHRLTRGLLILDAGPTDYAHFMGTNYLNHHRGDELGWEHFANPIGTSATVITSDGWLLYGRRSDRVACHPGYIHTFGGSLEADERGLDGTFDAFASIGRELGEELAVSAGDVVELVCLGLIRDAWIRQPELLFDARLDLTRSELEKRMAGDHEQEHEAVVAVRADRDEVLPFLTGATRIAPIAVGALCLHGRRRFGEAWYRRLMDGLAEVDLDAAPPAH